MRSETALNKFKATFPYSMDYGFYLRAFPSADFHPFFLFTTILELLPPLL